MAKIVGVTDIPDLPGAGMLEFDDGRPPIMALPEIAETERDRLGLRRSINEGAADNSPGIVQTVKSFLSPPEVGVGSSPLAQRQREREQQRAQELPHGGAGSEADRANVAAGFHPAPAPAPGAPAPAAPSAPAGAPPPAAAPPTTDQLAAQAEDAERRAALGRLEHGVWDPGSAGRKAGYIPNAQSTTVERGPAVDDAAEAKRQELGNAYLAAQQAKVDADKARADEEAKRAALGNLEASQKAAKLEADIIEREAQHKQQDAAMQKDLADYTESAKPDPKKFWSTPGGAVSELLSIIGQGLGAFAAIRSGTENFAFKAAQARIAREIDAQEKAWNAGRGDRKSAYARMVEHYNGNQDLARLGLREALGKVAQTETERAMAQSRSDDATANGKILAAKFAQDQLEAAEARKALAAGKTTTTEAQRYQEAIAARAPGYHQQTQAQKDADLKRAGPKKSTDSNFEANRIKYGEKKEAEAPANALVEKLAGRIGAVRDPETGRWTMPKGKTVSVAGHGSGSWKPDAITSQEGVDFRNDMADLNLQVGKMVSGADVPEQTQKQIAKLSGAGGADSDILPGLNRMQDKINSAARERDATYGLEVVKAHEAEKRKTDAHRQTNPANARETPE